MKSEKSAKNCTLLLANDFTSSKSTRPSHCIGHWLIWVSLMVVTGAAVRGLGLSICTCVIALKCCVLKIRGKKMLKFMRHVTHFLPHSIPLCLASSAFVRTRRKCKCSVRQIFVTPLILDALKIFAAMNSWGNRLFYRIHSIGTWKCFTAPFNEHITLKSIHHFFKLKSLLCQPICFKFKRF